MPLLIVLIQTQSQAQAQDTRQVFGRYVGVLKHKLIKQDQLARMDFIISRKDNNQLELMSVLTIFFGDFSSKEYTSYHFDQVKYDLLKGNLVFDEPDQELTLKTLKFQSGQLLAQVRSRTAGQVGTLELFLEKPANPGREIVAPLWGEYAGRCNEVDTFLQISTFRSTEDTIRVGNPFGSYEIRGQYGQQLENLCPNPENNPCITNVIYAGTYHYFTGHLNLFGKQKNLSCTVDPQGLDCQGCILKRQDQGEKTPMKTYPIMNKDAFASLVNEPIENSDDRIMVDPGNLLQGEYHGYLHHENLDLYQKADLDILTYQEREDTTGQKLKMSAVAKIHFGEENAGESLTYRFDVKTYSLLNQQFVFERAGQDVDAILQITSIKDSTIEGVWYSILFGRVGKFIFSKNKLSALPADKKYYQSIAGKYQSGQLDLYLNTRLGSTPINTENPYFPLVFGGYLYYQRGFATRIQITGGSFDFYTNRLGLLTNEGERVVVGERSLDESGPLYLKWSSRKFGGILYRQNFDLFSNVTAH